MTLLSDTESEEFRGFYKKLLREEFGRGPVTEADELAFCKELREGAERGAVPHGGEMHHVVPDESDYNADSAEVAVSKRPRSRNMAQLAILGALAVAFVAYTLLTVTGANSPKSSAAGGLVGSPTPQGASSTALPAFPAPTVAAGFVTVAGETLPTLRPSTLELRGRSFLVHVAPVKEGNWYVRQEPGIANWLPGSVVNWSFALYVDADPQASGWLAGLQSGTTATLRVVDGRALPFRITERLQINRSQTEFLDPHMPGLTVAVKVQAGDSRLLLRGTEMADNTPQAPPDTQPIVPGGGE